jgi:hypothetical protein
MVRRKYLLLVASLGTLAASCSNNDQATDPPVVTSSARGNLRFKGPERLNNDIAAALELPPDQVCTELGLYQCAALVHHVALGGVDPYGTGLYEASGVTSATTPLVVERIAWSACLKRADADYANPAAGVIFRGIPLDGARLANPDGDEVRGAITQLVQRALQRDPYPGELTRYTQLARDIEATGSAEPARAFMQAACFAVISLSEAVFY